ncbi:hypothetical protein JW752_05540 [Candidatus Peregrinibacteria bacterium]|nr:hypothetical protein [Candidatus Peregrinibacteria bacterium]
MNRFLLPLAVLSVVALTQGCQEDPQIHTETVYHDFGEEDDFLGGIICVDSNVAACPFSILNRHETYSVDDITFKCSLLPAEGYTVTFEEVPGYRSPGAIDFQLMAGQETFVRGTYAPN